MALGADIEGKRMEGGRVGGSWKVGDTIRVHRSKDVEALEERCQPISPYPMAFDRSSFLFLYISCFSPRRFGKTKKSK